MTTRGGLDFGTTFSTLSCLSSGRFLELVLDRTPFIPTIISFFDGESVLVGELAKNVQRFSNSYTTFYDLKRWVGVSEKNFNRLKAKIDPKYDCFFKENDCHMSGVGTVKRYLPVKTLINTYIKILINLFEDQHHCKISTLNVSVPADYTTRQRSYMRTILNNLGVKVERMLNEPSAAAIYSTFKSPESNDFLIFDFGGGTFDISYIKKKKNSLMIVDTEGDLFLGGRNIDNAIREELLKLYFFNPSELMLSNLKEDVSRSGAEHHSILDENKQVKQVKYGKKQLDKCVQPFAERAVKLLSDVVLRNNISECTISMVGGSSLLQEVQRQVTLFADSRGFNVSVDQDLRLSVSYGCSCLHHLLDNREFLYVDVNSHSLIDFSIYLQPEIIVRKPMPVPYTHRVERRNDLKFDTSAIVLEGDSPSILDNDLIYSASFSTTDVSALGSGYFIEYKLNVEGNISVSIGDIPGTKVKHLESNIDHTFKVIDLKYNQIQLSTSEKYSSLVAMAKYYDMFPEMHKFNVLIPFTIKEFCDRNGGFNKYFDGISSRNKGFQGK
uniref:HSP70-like protein n=1 Tax=Pyrus virus A TaxID=3139198 RepID=A0AAU6RVQ9_9CLOS